MNTHSEYVAGFDPLSPAALRREFAAVLGITHIDPPIEWNPGLRIVRRRLRPLVLFRARLNGSADSFTK